MNSELGPLDPPREDPAPLFDLYRGSFATELLVAASAHLRLFERLGNAAKPIEALRGELGLSERAATVLFTALRAMGMLRLDSLGRLEPTAIAREHLLPGGEFSLHGYLGLAAESPGVLAMAERLRTNRPSGVPETEKAAYMFREGIESAMDDEASARSLTLALAGRARCVAPTFAARARLDGVRTLLDVGGGSGLYAIACLRRYPALRAIVWDRAEVLKVAAEMARRYGVEERCELLAGDMFVDPVPRADAILLSNVLHDWDVPECRAIVGRSAAALPRGGRLLIHDAYLSDTLDGPLAVALYSAALFSITEGRVYSAAECRGWLREAGLAPGEIVPTLIHCGILPGLKDGGA